MASLGSSSRLLSITSFIKDLKAMENIVLITLENHTVLGRAESSSKSRERCRKAVDGSRGPVRFYLIQAPGAFVWFSPDKRALVSFVDVEGAHERPDRRSGWRQIPMGAFPLPNKINQLGKVADFRSPACL